ncbi:MAG: site-specific integrase [Bacteroidales bacterium]
MTYRFALNSKTSKKGLYSVFLFLVHNNKRKAILLPNVLVFKSDWNHDRQMAFVGTKDAGYINAIIAKTNATINDYLLTCTLEKKEPHFKDIEKLLLPEKKVFISFFDLLQIIEDSDDHTPGTKKMYRSIMKKLKEYAPTLAITDIDESFIIAYKKHLKNIGNSHNTIIRDLKKIKTLCLYAKKTGLIQHNPFLDIKLREKEGSRAFLDKTELLRLEYLRNSDNISTAEKNMLSVFLFACYTGLRYSDVFGLKYKNIENGYLSITMQKTQEILRVPITEKAINLLPVNPKGPEQKVFKVPTNQVLNRYLKEFAERAGIRKIVTCHVARHTFATLAISAGMPLTFLQKLLGHNLYRTTLLYAKIINPALEEEVKKLNAYF